MSKDHKYRAWDNKNKKWLLGYGYKSLGGFSLVGETIMMGEWGNVFWSFLSSAEKKFEDLKIMEYTGIDDSEGVEVYEDDIYETPFMGTGVVKWDNELSGFYVYVADNAEDERALYLRDPKTKEVGKVVGNIWENPELITTKQ